MLTIAIAALSGVVAVGGAPIATAADSGKFITPRSVVYPGDVIDGAILGEVSDNGRYGDESIVRDVEGARGRVARKTLLPGMPIPVAALSARKVVRNGVAVRLIFTEGELTIVATGDALQDGAAGETIRCRNSSSGVVVSGVVQADGSVRIGS